MESMDSVKIPSGADGIGIKKKKSITHLSINVYPVRYMERDERI